MARLPRDAQRPAPKHSGSSVYYRSGCRLISRVFLEKSSVELPRQERGSFIQSFSVPSFRSRRFISSHFSATSAHEERWLFIPLGFRGIMARAQERWPYLRVIKVAAEPLAGHRANIMHRMPGSQRRNKARRDMTTASPV